MKEFPVFHFHSRFLHLRKSPEEISAFERVSSHFRMARNRAVAEVPEWEEYRKKAEQIREETLKNWRFWVQEWRKNAEARGIQVLWAQDSEEACCLAENIIKDYGKTVVKSKSMVTEEIHLNAFLEKKGYRVVETDLGEFLIQQAGHTPSHLIAPAVHLSRFQVAQILAEKTGMPYTEKIEKMTEWVRQHLRQEFLHAPIGISGVNFAIAETGQVALVENEGNARMVTTLPRLHLMFLTPEKILPRWEDLWLFLTLLIRSATGQRLSSYISLFPGRSGDPVKRVAIFVDNGRSRLLDDPSFRTILRCIRCGACLNFCPVYRSVGGHTYPWVIAGPIGAILSPALLGVHSFGDLSFASTLCGACSDVCPVRIPIPDFLHHFRTLQKRRSTAWIYRILFWLYAHPTNYRLLHFFLRIFPHAFFESQQGVLSFPLFQNWIQGRSALIPAPKSFYTLWREREQWQKPPGKTS